MSYTVLIVDDEPDIHAVTKLSLKHMQIEGEELKLVFADSGAAALKHMAKHPETAVILMDVVMEHEYAGLATIQEIRGELGNEMVRILLRTGQPGIAPEKQVIDDYDIDGYLAKAEMTQTRLYSSVRAALKSFSELQEIQRYRDLLIFINQSLMTLHEAKDLDTCLQQLVEIANASVTSTLTLLYIENRAEDGRPQSHLYYSGPESMNSEELEKKIEDLLQKMSLEPEVMNDIPGEFADGYLVPLHLSSDKGQGFLYVQTPDLAHGEETLPILAGHAAIAINHNL